jgi:hypothetical protein
VDIQQEEVLSKLEDKGFILTDDILERYHAKMPKTDYGDLLFHLNPPYVFNVINPEAVSMHGYLPEYLDSDGVLVSNKKLKRNVVILQDIVPSILQVLGLKIPEYMDGEPIWI